MTASKAASNAASTAASTAARRPLVLALGLMVAGSVLGWWAMSSTWITIEESLLGTSSADGIAAISLREISGSRLFPLAAAAPIIGLAGVAGVIGSRGWLRRGIGGVVVVSGAVVVWSGFSAIGFLRSGASAGNALPGIDGEVVSVSSVFSVIALIAGLMLVIGGAMTAYAGGRWPALGRGYERTGRLPRDDWEALDSGIDPTLEPPTVATEPGSATSSRTEHPKTSGE